MAELKINVLGIDKLIDYVASGIGAVAGSMLAPWRAGRDAKARIIAAQGTATEMVAVASGEAEALQIIAEARKQANETLEPIDQSVVGELTMDSAVGQRLYFQETKRHNNIKQVARLAAAEIGDQTVGDVNPDHDWTARFFGEVQDVTNEDMQFLWAKVLAGEVVNPGSTSLRTLSVLRNLDQRTARLFVKLCSLSVTYFGAFEMRVLNLGNYDDGNGLAKYGLDYGSLNDLHESELITADFNSWRDFAMCAGMSIPDNRQIVRLPFRFLGNHWVFAGSGQPVLNQSLKLHGVALNRAGRELSQFVGIENEHAYGIDLKLFFKSLGFQMVKVDSDQPQVFTLGAPTVGNVADA